MPTMHYMKVAIRAVPGKRLNAQVRQDTGDKRWYFYLALWKGDESKWVRVGRQMKEYGPFVSFEDALVESKRVAMLQNYSDEALAGNARFQ